MSSATYNHIKSYRVLAYAYFNNKCVECNSIKNLRIHHKDKNSSNNNLSNLTLLCSKCHGNAHSFGSRPKEGIIVKCKKCEYSWMYTGKNPMAPCPCCCSKIKTGKIIKK